MSEGVSKVEEELSIAQSEVAAWCNAHMKTFEEEITSHQAFMANHHDSINRLALREKQLKEQAELLRMTLEKEQRELEKLHAEIASLRVQEESLPSALTLERKKLQAARAAAEQRSQEIEEKERELRNLLKESSHGVDYYKDRLGLEFEKIEDTSLRFCFTKIDPTNPDKRFIFSVLLDENDVYRGPSLAQLVGGISHNFMIVTECNPRVDGLSNLVEKLNATNNFSGFVQYMRKLFQEKCGK